MLTPYLTLIALPGLWALYFALHSLLAADGVKRWIADRWPLVMSWYRLIYNLLALVLLAGLLWLTRRWEGDALVNAGFLRIVGGLLVVGGVGVMAAAFRAFDLREFLGVGAEDRGVVQATLITGGIYRVVRHPLYFGTILLALGLVLLHPSPGRLAILAVVLIYLVIGSRLEERKLIREYGAAYIAYRQRVKGLLPGVW